MRPLTLSIHRAFPELDRFSDEQCQRFVRAARGRWWTRAFYILLLSGFFLATLVGGIFVAGTLSTPFAPNPAAGGTAFIDVLIIAPAAVLAPFSAFLIRDFVLRRRVRYILQVDGHCPQCRYSLLGLDVAADSTVTCPECGVRQRVNPALRQLGAPTAGFMVEALPAVPTLWFLRSPQFRRRLARAGLALLTLIGAPLALGWGYYEWIQRQAARATALAPTQASFALTTPRFGGGVGDPSDAWAALRSARDLMRQVCSMPEYQEHRWWSPAFDCLAPLNARVPVPESERAEQTALALKALDLLRSRDINAIMRTVATGPADPAAWAQATLPQSAASNGLYVWRAPREFEADYSLWRMLQAQLRLAHQASDLNAACAHLEELLALADLVAVPGTPGDVGSSDAITAAALQDVASIVRRRPGSVWAERFDEVIQRRVPAISFAQRAEGARLASRSIVCQVFAVPEATFTGYFTGKVLEQQHFGNAFQPSKVFWLGTLEQNLAQVDAFFQAWGPIAAQDPWQRPSRAKMPFIDAAFPIAQEATRSDVIVNWWADQLLCAHRGWRITVALNAYHAQHGRFPETLAQAQADDQLDPWSGQPFGYVIKPDGFLLYSVGDDRLDNQGGRGDVIIGP